MLNFPEEFICAMTQDLMEEPVFIQGAKPELRYERAALKQWISAHGTDPATGEKLINPRLISDDKLKHAIQIYVAQNLPRIKNELTEAIATKDYERIARLNDLISKVPKNNLDVQIKRAINFFQTTSLQPQPERRVRLQNISVFPPTYPRLQ